MYAWNSILKELQKLLESRITATPEYSRTINLDTDKLEQTPSSSSSRYPLDAWSVSF